MIGYQNLLAIDTCNLPRIIIDIIKSYVDYIWLEVNNTCIKCNYRRVDYKDITPLINKSGKLIGGTDATIRLVIKCSAYNIYKRYIMICDHCFGFPKKMSRV